MSLRDGRAAIEIVAAALDDLREEVMFLGGAIAGLLVTSPEAPPPRLTDDVDIVVDVATYANYVHLTTRLRELGFVEDASEGAPTCRWLIQGIKVDLMSTGHIPGPTSRWYSAAMANAQPFGLSAQLRIRVITAPYFIATKLDAFGDGRRGDYLSSHDLEDVIAVVDGRATLVSEVLSSPPDVRAFLIERFKTLTSDLDFVDAIAGHLPGDDMSQARLPLVLSRMRAIATAV